MKVIKPGLRIGILGGGQLARMLCLKGQEMGFEMHVFSAHKTDPAAQVTAFHHQGTTQQKNSLKKFIACVDYLTFESEFVNIKDLKLAARGFKNMQPHPDLMALLQDRWSQKLLLAQNKIPTADFVIIDNHSDLKKAFTHFGEAFVIKKRMFGYDGYGTFVVRTKKDLAAATNKLPATNTFCIAEKWIPFRRELAISLVNNGKIIEALPLVETFQQNSRCLWVKGPTQHKAAPSLTLKLKKFLETLDYRGLITFELFDCGRDLAINEVAPRVHNSAHYTLDALNCDQFSLHLRAITGQSLPSIKPLSSGFAMWNLLGQSQKVPIWTLPSNSHLHWYGKKENRAGRKMGHLNSLASSPDKALAQVRKAQRKFKL